MLARLLLWGSLLFGLLRSSPSPGKLFGKITSPNYPQPYPNNNTIKREIVVPKGLRVKLNFWHFDLEPSASCMKDYVNITAVEKDKQFCGQQGSNKGTHPGSGDFFSKGNRMELVFHSDSSNEENGTITPYKGFLAYYRPVVVNCGDPKNLTNGAFSYVKEHRNNNYQSVITYRCNEPYYSMETNRGNCTYTCSAQGTWVDQDGQENIPVCLPVCGKPDKPITRTQRIIGGSIAPPGSFPWQAKIHIHGLGGGALLGDRWILTAAHVIYPKQISSTQRKSPDEVPEEAEVFLGHTKVDEIHKLGNRPIHRVFVHPTYDPDDETNFDGDIALIELRDPVPLGPNLLPVCLPDVSNSTFYASRYMGYVSGFGVEKNFLANELKYVSLPVGNQAACKKWLQGQKVNGKLMVFSENMFCAGSPTGGKDTCQGDAGSVFTVQDPESERWIGTGITSWGLACGKSFGFYTKIINYLDWINQTIVTAGL
ncbi:complement C1r subcomponent-like [Carettochelys insculpta]|uniref:complement C1r subcomponent-like n=1 Tax=Carettochelys insculpta TaxID=44489 RepID=UPI003EBD4665